ncbi:MAG: F0F1 ATP synthase subunit A [Fimbriimonadaceae bacterium]|nr:F0F1 ATP synthase subunit A [Fimbriimonadaceae bacterium]QYK56926.1 MAG: F0F1 ATP synthase subunit A [Fimbriimonadaceae bacterium]
MRDLLPGLLPSLLAEAEHAAEGGHSDHHAAGFYIFIYVGITIAVMVGFFMLMKQGLSTRGAKTLPAKLGEHIYLFLDRMCVSIIGPHGRQYLPFLATLWFFIFTSNILGLFMDRAATGNLAINAAMALITVIYVQYAGIQRNGLAGHLKHFAGPAGIPIFISVLLFVVELVSETAKIGSLTLRLFANIEGGHLVVKNINDLLTGQLAGIPLGGLLLPIKLLSAILQAFIWVMLTSVYLNLVTHHEGHDEHDDHDSPVLAGAH